MDQAKATGEGWQLALPVNAQLGEGLHWDAARQCLWMVDIHGRRLLRWDLQAAQAREWSLEHRIGWVLPDDSGRWLLLGLQPGIACCPVDHPAELSWLARPFGADASLRLNDAKADATGAIWAGSLNNDDESRSDGCLFRFDGGPQMQVQDTGYLVANGPAISPDGRLMLHTDSGRRTIYAFDLDLGTGQLDRRRVWHVFAENEGYPDGMCFDAEGAVWVAHWGAACISRFDAQARLMRRVQLPVPHVTNVCFAGADCERLFVSSARVGLSAQALEAAPLSGALFEIMQPGVRGLPGRPCATPTVP